MGLQVKLKQPSIGSAEMQPRLRTHQPYPSVVDQLRYGGNRLAQELNGPLLGDMGALIDRLSKKARLKPEQTPTSTQPQARPRNQEEGNPGEASESTPKGRTHQVPQSDSDEEANGRTMVKMLKTIMATQGKHSESMEQMKESVGNLKQQVDKHEEQFALSNKQFKSLRQNQEIISESVEDIRDTLAAVVAQLSLVMQANQSSKAHPTYAHYEGMGSRAQEQQLPVLRELGEMGTYQHVNSNTLCIHQVVVPKGKSPAEKAAEISDGISDVMRWRRGRTLLAVQPLGGAKLEEREGAGVVTLQSFKLTFDSVTSAFHALAQRSIKESLGIRLTQDLNLEERTLVKSRIPVLKHFQAMDGVMAVMRRADIKVNTTFMFEQDEKGQSVLVERGEWVFWKDYESKLPESADQVNARTTGEQKGDEAFEDASEDHHQTETGGDKATNPDEHKVSQERSTSPRPPVAPTVPPASPPPPRPERQVGKGARTASSSPIATRTRSAMANSAKFGAVTNDAGRGGPSRVPTDNVERVINGRNDSGGRRWGGGTK